MNGIDIEDVIADDESFFAKINIEQKIVILIDNLSHFVNGIKNLKLDENDILVRFDVVSLYTKFHSKM